MYEENIIPEANGTCLNEVMKKDLAGSAKWAKIVFFANLIFIACGVVALLASFLVVQSVQSGVLQIKNGIYAIIFLLYIYPVIKGTRFAECLKNACSTGSQSELEQAFAALRPCVVWYTALAIISLAMSFFI